MNWTEVSGNARPYATLIKYWCNKTNWGFPSTGLQEAWAMCNHDGIWNITEIEECTGTSQI